MKYIRTFEKFDAEKYKEFKELKEFVIFEYENHIFLGHFTMIDITSYYTTISGVFYLEPNYTKNKFYNTNIDDIKILESFDSFEKAKERYILQKNAHKYNI